MTLTEQKIETLLALCQKGNQLAQLEVYNRYQKAMYNTALRIVKDTAEAEDVMQESFITAFQKLDSFKGTATFGAWLKRIVVNNSIVQYRKNQRFTMLPEYGLEEEAEETLSEAEDYTTVKAEEVLTMMEGIHPNYKTILSLHFIEGYDYEEICEILEISYANCRTMISRAKESLRKKLQIV
ncbi:MAG: RNA polymerase subunit sigma [Alteromonas sp.]|nr:RNA polymerase subunit sigma [Alteromonas sp.]MAY22208.1 RNA polymerase subunit sigma [Flavobacteriaceae bacterium]